MSSFHAVPNPNPCEPLQQQPASWACLVKPPGPSHMFFCIKYPSKSQNQSMVEMGPRRTPQGVAMVGEAVQAAQGCC